MVKSLTVYLVFLVGGLFFLASTCFTQNEKAKGPESTPGPAEGKIAQSSNEFGLKLFQQIVKSNPGRNVFISPLSVSMALAMTYNGADGRTKEAMANTLGLSGLSIDSVNIYYRDIMERMAGLDPKVVFKIANSIWYRQGFDVEPDFLDLNETYFDAEVGALDFNSPQAADVIDRWVNENTEGKIKQIVSRPIDPMMMMFLINAIYFLGDWTDPFKANDTRDDKFFLLDGSETTCKMMSKNETLKFLETNDFQAVELPYGEGIFGMLILLPKPEIHIDELIKKLDPDSLSIWLGGLNLQRGKLFLPKFKLEYELSLIKALTAMGMGIAFSHQADFTGINKRGELYISEVKHKTYVKVDEKGTEAAAVTSVGMMATGVPPPDKFVMRVDRPFLIMIRENDSKAILFTGKIVEPLMD